MEIRRKVTRFLEKYGMDYHQVDLAKNTDAFIEDMEAGLAGHAKSLLMLPTFIRTDRKLQTDKKIIVMDAGGTNFRVATVSFDSGRKPSVENFLRYDMPGTHGAIDKNCFFQKIADYMLPVINESDKVGFCFSFPTEILPNHDGRLVALNKEVQVNGAEHAVIGKKINQVLKQRGLKEKKFVLLNDTVATMLAGFTDPSNRIFDSYIGFIYGTGTNTCYIENCRNIGELPAECCRSGKMAVNMESGGYRGFKRGVIDERLDAATQNPGEHPYEKMVSGAYEGTIIYLTVKQACGDGLFSSTFASLLEQVHGFTMRQIDDFCYYPFGDNLLAELTKNREEDRLTLYWLIDSICERSARLAAVNLAAILKKTETGTDPTRPVCIVAEGTNFYKSKLFRTKLDYCIRKFINEELGAYCEFFREDDATLVGAAVAGLFD